MPLRVTFEIVPGGDESRTEKIGHLYITQVGNLGGDLREYLVADCLRQQEWTVRHHRSEGAEALVHEAIARRPFYLPNTRSSGEDERG